MIANHAKVSLLIVLTFWLIAFGSAYFAWFFAIPRLWASSENNLVGWAGIVLGTSVLILVPLLSAAFALNVGDFVASANMSSEAANLRAARERVRDAEKDALKRLEEKDGGGLLPLLRYSRAQLDEYYAMGLAQTTRTFRHALIAMWLGFTLLVLGLALYVAPVERLNLHPPSGNFNFLILSSAVIIEFISVLFLWFYRSTMGQLTFYYRLQIRNHNAILCFRIATSMEAESDEAKRAIIASMLDFSLMPERPEVQGSAGLRGWGGAPPPPAQPASET
jgi:hypothetical protein